MPEQQQDYVTPLLAEFNTKIRDLEEKQRLLKERVLLIGNNLIEMREEINKDTAELKVSAEQAKQDILKTRETLQRISEELENFARKSEMEILKKQAKMFQPLNLARLEDVESIINKNMKKM